MYSFDGKIRFSQNSQQALENKFSYTNYDRSGRLIEAGVYTMSGSGPYVFENHYDAGTAAKSVHDIVNNYGGAGALDAARCSEVSRISYDLPDPACPEPQHFLYGNVSYSGNENVTTWYSYDYQGRLEWMIQDITGLGIKKIAYIYDFMGNVLQVAYQPGQAEAFYHHYEYDADQRVTHVYTSKDGVNKTLQAHYEYYLHGPVKRVEVGGNLQGTDYLYTLQGGLKSINHGDISKDPGADGVTATENENFLPDAFGMNLLYHDQDYTAAGYDFGNYSVSGSVDSYSGNIKAISWHNANNSNEQVMYDYRYDEKYQLTNANFGKVNQSGNNYSFQQQVDRYAVGVTYQDSHGNIGTLNRKDEDGTAIGNYNYSYKTNSNQLEDVKHDGASFMDYQYNAIGQMTSQTEAGIGEMHLVYDAYGMVKEIYADAAKTLPLVKFAYDDRGNRLLKKSYDESGNSILDTWYVRDAAGTVVSIYTQDYLSGTPLHQSEIPVYGASRLGMYSPAEDGYYYEINDHLGNVRAVVASQVVTLPFPATMEPAQSAYEEAEFVNIANTRHQDLLNSKTGSHSAHLNHSMGKINGPGIGLKINPGDKVDITAYAKYESGLENFNNNFDELILAFASSFGYNGGSETAKIFDMFDQLPAGAIPGNGFDVPKAYIIGLFFDNYYNYVDANLYSRITEEADGHWQELTGTRTFDQPGYLYIITATENKDNVDIFFDDVHIDLHQTHIVAGNDYYPFGIPITERSYEKQDYRYDYQGQYAEKDDETGFNAFQLRQYDARIGRWIRPDPYKQFASAYVGMGNNPVSGVDPDGGWSWTTAAIGAGVGGVAGYIASDGDWRYALGGAVAGGALGGVMFNEPPNFAISEGYMHYTSGRKIILNEFGNKFLRTSLDLATAGLRYYALNNDSDKKIYFSYSSMTNDYKKFNKKKYYSHLRNRLNQGGFDPEVKFKSYSLWDNIKSWWNDETYAVVKFRIPHNLKETRQGGHATPYSNKATILFHKSLSNLDYANITAHELGHAIFGFAHIENTANIMYPDVQLNANQSFSKAQIEIIKNSKWGK